MTFKMALVIFAVINVIGFHPYRKKIRLINIIIVGIIVYFLVSIRNTPDINNYMIRFSGDFYSVKDPGFNILARFFYNMNWNYFQFQTFVYLGCLSLICQGLIRVIQNRTLIYFLYMAYPLLLNAVQVRNFIGASILVFAVCTCAVEKNKAKKRIKWCAYMLIATGIHVSMIVFIPFIFLSDKKEILIIIAGGFLCIAELLYIYPDGILYIITKLASIVDKSYRASTSYITVSTRFGGIIMITEAVLLLYYAYKMRFICFHSPLYSVGCNEYMFSSFCERLILYSIIFTPLYVLNTNFTRLIQNTALLLYGMFSIAYGVRDKRSNKVLIIRMEKDMVIPTLLAFIIFCYHVWTLWIGSYDTVVRPLLLNLSGAL